MTTDFAIWLRGMRGERTKLSVERGSGVHRASVMRAENGSNLLSIRSLRKLCDFYGCDFSNALVLMSAARMRRDGQSGREVMK